MNDKQKGPTTMMTSILLVDVQGFETLAKGQANPAALAGELSDSTQDEAKPFAVMRAYCSPRVSSYRRAAYREAGFEIVESAGPDETLIRMSCDLCTLAHGGASYGEAILLGGATDYSALARLAHERLMQIAVIEHPGLSPAMQALADRLINLDDLEIDRSTGIPPAPSFKPRERSTNEPLSPRPSRLVPEKSAPAAPATDQEGDPWPDSRLVAGSAAGAGAGALMAGRTSANGAAQPAEAAGDDAEEAAPKTEAKPEEAKQDEAKPAAKTKPEEAKPQEAKPREARPAVQAANPVAAKAHEPEVEKPSVTVTEPSTVTPPATSADIEADLEADLAAELMADIPEPTPQKADAPEAKPAADAPDDNDIDALFADLVPEAPAAAEPAKAPADKPEPAAASQGAQSDEDVDELLSRLMSDDLADATVEPKKAELDVVPER